MNETIAISSWHIVVDLRDHIPGALGGGQRGVHANPKTAISVRIRRGDLNQGDVNRHCATLEQLFNFAEIDWSVVGTAVIDRLAYVRTDENGVVAKVWEHLGRDVGSYAHSHHVNDFHPTNCRRPTYQCLNQRLRLCAAWLDVHTHSRLDHTHGLVSRPKSAHITSFPEHKFRHLLRYSSESSRFECLVGKLLLITEPGVVNGPVEEMI